MAQSKKHLGKASALLLLLAALIALSCCGEADTSPATIVIGGTEYPLDSEALDLSGQTELELELIKTLTGLKQLDLRSTGVTLEQVRELSIALPDCEIIWSVPFQDTYVDSNTTSVRIERISGADMDVLELLPNLTTVHASSCRDYEALFALQERFPHLKVLYLVNICGTEFFNNATDLRIVDPDAHQILRWLPYLPEVKTVTLLGDLPNTRMLLNLKNAFPDISFIWSFEMFGVTVSSTDTFVDLSGVKVTSVEELEAFLPRFYDLKQVDLGRCSISSAELEALNLRCPDTKFVWEVRLCGNYLRTDITWFMPYQFHNGVNRQTTANLRYCTDLELIDMGHYKLSNIDFVQYMPNLRFLLLCDTELRSITPITQCTKLEYLELMDCWITDFWPLTNLKNLRDLNIARNPHLGSLEVGALGDITPLTQLTWLDRLWMPHNAFSAKNVQTLRDALPNTQIVFYTDGTTSSGFRYTPRYYQQRDMLGMPYYHN